MTTATNNEVLFRSLLKVHIGMADLAEQGLIHEDESNHIVERVLANAGVAWEEWEEWVQN